MNNPYDFERVWEVCPHCGEEVELEAELKVQTCPKCGKRIVTCSMCLACETEENYCSKCCLCYQAKRENEDPLTKAEIRKNMLSKMDLVRGAYGFRKTFDAGYCPDVDEYDVEGVDIYDVDAEFPAYLAHVDHITPVEIESMTQDEYESFAYDYLGESD